jgi:DNA-binding transcriptional ArsR family regulator
MAKTAKRIVLSDQALELVANRFRLLAEPTRLKILQTLGHDEMTVTELVDATGSSQANVSKHLAALLSSAVVARRKDGLNAHYRVTDESIFDLCDAVCSRLKDEVVSRHAILNNRRG